MQREQQAVQNSSGTLGDVLYADPSKPRESEQDWVRLVRSVAAGDELALHALYERAHRPAFTLIMRLTADRETAEELTLDVFHDVWRRASDYDPANGTVLAWIMRRARASAIERLRFEERTMRVAPAAGGTLRTALAVLRPDERQAIEAAFCAGLTDMETAARLDQPLGATKTLIRSGLHKLRQVLGGGSGEATAPGLARNHCSQSELTCAYALRAMSSSPMSAAEKHISSCPQCERELESLRGIVDTMASWPADVLRPSPSLKERLARGMAAATGRQPVFAPALRWSEPDWEEVALGISCKLLATDTERHRVSMLVRLAPNASYPPHTHAGVEELHLLNGELWIDDRKLFAGDYNLGVPGTGDTRVWSETGCACVLITSTRDQLA